MIFHPQHNKQVQISMHNPIHLEGHHHKKDGQEARGGGIPIGRDENNLFNYIIFDLREGR